MFYPADRGSQITMSKHTKTQERPRDGFCKEHTPDPWWDIRKGISHTANYEVLERRRFLHEEGAVLRTTEIPLLNKTLRQLDHFSQETTSPPYQHILLEGSTTPPDEPIRAPKTHDALITNT